MKTKFHHLIVTPPLLALAALLSGLSTAHAQGTAFTYQGQLQNNGSPAIGTYNLMFTLYNANTAGTVVAGPVTTNGVVVSNGLFTVSVDFGPNVFTGQRNWLQVAVETNGGGSFATLTPRQELTPAPNAIYAETSGSLLGNLPASQLVGTLPSPDFSGAYGYAVNLDNAGNSFTGNGSGLTGVNAATVGGLGAASFWQLTGNAGTTPGVNYLGTPDNTAFEIKVNNARALLIQPDTIFSIPNIIFGHSANLVTAGYYGNTIGGGGWLGSDANQILAGSLNVVAGGIGNTISNATSATIAGGEFNTVSNNPYGAVGGGYNNLVSGYAATVPGGEGNTATGDHSFAAGLDAQALHAGSFVWADSTGSSFADTGSNQFQVRAANGVWFHNGTNGVNIDAEGMGYGNLDFGLRFGAPVSGEGIASDRTTATNQYGLDFYTDYAPRMAITQAGRVGINTKTPAAQLHVHKGAGSGQGDGYNGGPAIMADTSTGDGLFASTSDGAGFGVLAIATSGVGVNASATNGTGVSASSTSGNGVQAYSSSGTAIYTSVGGTNSALTVGSGAIHVLGAGIATSTTAFIQVATAANINGNVTYIDNPYCNGDPNALLFATHQLSPGNSAQHYNTHPFGVWYNTSSARWAVYNDDETTMTAGQAWNILVIKN